jgi:hypothetical protein
MNGDPRICSACGRAVETGASHCPCCGVRIAWAPQGRLGSVLRRISDLIREQGQPFEQDPQRSLRLYRHSPIDHY